MQHSQAICVSFLLQAFVEALHPGERDTSILQQHGLLQRSVMAHGTCLRDHELNSMASAGAAIAHCPLSNFFFGDEILAVRDVLAQGVAVGLGTDVAGGEGVPQQHLLSSWAAQLFHKCPTLGRWGGCRD